MKHKFYFFLMSFCMLNTIIVFAQDDEDFPEPPPPAPINRYVIILLLIGVAFAWQVMKKKTRKREIPKEHL